MSTPTGASGEPAQQPPEAGNQSPSTGGPQQRPPAGAPQPTPAPGQVPPAAMPAGGPPSPPRGPRQTVTLTVPLGKMLYLCVAGLGVINLFIGYVSPGGGDSMNLYKAALAIFAIAPTMLFLAGLVSLRAWLPRERSPGALPAMITSAIYVTVVLSAITSNGAGDLQTLFLVFGAVQFVFAWLAYLFDSGVIRVR